MKRIKFGDIKKSKGKTVKDEVDSLSDVDINKGIFADPDTPNLSDKDLAELKKPKKRNENEKN